MAELDIGCAQIFGSNKMQWRPRKFNPQQVADYRRVAAAAGRGPVFSHGIYLANFGARDANPPVWQKSIAATIAGLEICDRLGLAGLIVHLGSNYGLGLAGVFDSVVCALDQVLSAHRGTAKLILENSAGSERIIGGRLAELGQIMAGLKSSSKVAICIDTAHAFAFGYDLRKDAGVASLANDLEQHIGAENLAVMHVNDSKAECLSLRDRHANLGEGHIGLEGISKTVRHPLFANAPLVLETPGFADEGPDAANLALLAIAAGQGDGDPAEIIAQARAAD